MPSALDLDFFNLGDFSLQSGATLPGATIAYRTHGTLNAAHDNAILIPTFYAGHHTDCEPMLAAGRAIDPARHFVVVANMFGNGLSSSPSNTPAPHNRGHFPHVTVYDNVMAQHRLLTEHLGISHLKLVTGFSMGAMQAFHWAALYPAMMDAIAPICGSARIAPHNFVFLDGVKAALLADAAFMDGWYTEPPVKGIAAFGRVYAGWVDPQDFFRDEEYRRLGMTSVEEVMRASEMRYLQRDANDLLAMLWTWQHADVGAHPTFGGDTRAALRAITARAIVMPSSTDLYFRVRDNELEVAHMSHAELRPIPSSWGHAAGRGANPADNAFVDIALRELLA